MLPPIFKNNIFSLYLNQGSGFFVGTLGGDDSEDFLEVNLTYGREIEWIITASRATILHLLNCKIAKEPGSL